MISKRRTLLIAGSCLALFLGMGPVFAQEKVRRNVEVEWEPVEAATQYEIQIVRKTDGGKKTRVKTQKPTWAATIKPGLYTFQVRSYDARGVPGDWSEPSDLQVKLPSVVMLSPQPGASVQAGTNDKQEIALKWEAVTGAENYKVTVRSTTGDWQEEKETSDSEWRVKVPVGQKLEWNVTALDRKGEPGEVNPAPQPFTVIGTLTKPEVTQPMSKYVDEVEWTPAPKAKSYTYQLDYKNPKSEKWEKIESKSDVTENKIKWDIKRPSGRYRLKVRANAENRKPSPVATMEFETRGNFRDPAALENAILRDSITKPTNFYAIASYLLTDISYQAYVPDVNMSSSFSAVGGTGRIGLGYQDPDSAWGGFGIMDMSGFSISGQTFTFASVELHATRKLEFGQGGLLLFGTGLFSKELPVLKGSTTVGFAGVGKVREIGPHAGFTYWIPLSKAWGLQANARAYYAMMGSVYTGAKPQGSLSYLYGLLGSYRLSPAWMGYAGYAFRKDEAKYSATPGGANYSKAGDVNVIDISGHYLNVILEFSF